MLEIQVPIRVHSIIAFGITVVFRRQRRRCDLARARRGAPIQANPLDLHRQRVTGDGSIHLEQARLRITAQSSGNAMFVDASRVYCCGPDRIAGIDAQHRRERVVNQTRQKEAVVRRLAPILISFRKASRVGNLDTTIFCAPIVAAIVGHGFGLAVALGGEPVRRDAVLREPRHHRLGARFR